MVQRTEEYRYLFELVISIPSDIYPEVGLLDHMAVLFLNFWGSSTLFTIAAVPIYISTNSAQGLSSLHILANPCYPLSFFYNRGEVISPCGFDLYFPDVSDAE